MASSPLRFMRLRSDVQPPTRVNPNAAGFDIRTIEDVLLAPGGRACVCTGLQLEIPTGCYGRLAPRSGLATSMGLHVGAGVIDRDFTGEVRVLLFNFSNSPIRLRNGDRVAQLILEKISDVGAVEVHSMPETTGRGNAGFGSTGIA